MTRRFLRVDDLSPAEQQEVLALAELGGNPRMVDGSLAGIDTHGSVVQKAGIARLLHASTQFPDEEAP